MMTAPVLSIPDVQGKSLIELMEDKDKNFIGSKAYNSQLLINISKDGKFSTPISLSIPMTVPLKLREPIEA